VTLSGLFIQWKSCARRVRSSGRMRPAMPLHALALGPALCLERALQRKFCAARARERTACGLPCLCMHWRYFLILSGLLIQWISCARRARNWAACRQLCLCMR